MDNVKVFMAALLKYHFWVLVVVALLAGLTCWAMATGNMAKQYQQRKQKLDGDLKKMQAIENEPDHPNDKVLETIRKRQTALADNVFTAWSKLYQQQQEKNPWPTVLGEEFSTVMKQLAEDEEIPENFRQLYQTFIAKHFVQLRDQIGVLQRIDDGSATARNPTRPEGEEIRAGEYRGIVFWDERDRSRMEAAFSWSTVPTSAQVRFAQEDLWVYEALLRIIKNVNSRATGYHDAAIKRIDTMAIGKEAGAAWSKFEASRAAAGGSSDSGGSSAPQLRAGEVLTDELIAAMLKENRYLDQNQRPLRAADPQPFAEFKMMPVQLQLYMRQRSIPELLVQCTNSNMPVEVKVLRTRSNEGVISTSSTDGAASRTGTAAAADEKSRQYVVVEVLGIIYIYNSPDRSKVQAAGAGGAPSGGEDEPKPPAESQPPAENPDNPPPAENPPDAAAPPAEPPA